MKGTSSVDVAVVSREDPSKSFLSDKPLRQDMEHYQNTYHTAATGSAPRDHVAHMTMATGQHLNLWIACQPTRFPPTEVVSPKTKLLAPPDRNRAPRATPDVGHPPPDRR
jgi:hypothetical protein